MLLASRFPEDFGVNCVNSKSLCLNFLTDFSAIVKIRRIVSSIFAAESAVGDTNFRHSDSSASGEFSSNCIFTNPKCYDDEKIIKCNFFFVEITSNGASVAFGQQKMTRTSGVINSFSPFRKEMYGAEENKDLSEFHQEFEEKNEINSSLGPP